MTRAATLQTAASWVPRGPKGSQAPAPRDETPSTHDAAGNDARAQARVPSDAASSYAR